MRKFIIGLVLTFAIVAQAATVVSYPLSKKRGGTGADNSSVTFPASGTITTNAGTQTLTNKTISGASNTLTNIPLSALPASTYAISSGASGFATSTSGTYADVTNLSVSFTATGRPVMIVLVPDGSDYSGILCGGTSSVSVDGCFIKALRDSTDVGFHRFGSSYTQGSAGGTIYSALGAVSFVDVPSAGTYTYKIQYKITLANQSLQVRNAKLLVYQLF